MSYVGAVAAPHSHLQLFTRPAENEDYRAKVARGRKALGVLRGQVEKSGADTMLIIHDDHFVNFDFRCYPPFCLLIGKEAKGSGVIDPAEIEKITGAVYKKYQGKTSYGAAPAGMPQHVADWEGGDKPYVYRVDEELSVRMLKDLLAMGFDMPFSTNGTMDGELVLTQNFLNPKADKSIMLLFTNGYVPPIPHPRRCYELGRAIRKIIDGSERKVLVQATGGMSHFPGTPLYGEVDEEFDNHVLDLLAKGEARTLAAMSPEEILRKGNGELVNWIIAAGIIGDDVKATVVEYVRLWHIGLGYAYWEAR
jgi:Catalytic LigB subunit of aromatic ring-opening dioxygenase